MENQATAQPAGEQPAIKNIGDEAGEGNANPVNHIPVAPVGEDARIYAHATPRILTESQLFENDSKLQPFTAADVRLHSIFGDTCHQNAGTHMHSRVCPEKDKKVQRLHR